MQWNVQAPKINLKINDSELIGALLFQITRCSNFIMLTMQSIPGLDVAPVESVGQLVADSFEAFAGGMAFRRATPAWAWTIGQRQHLISCPPAACHQFALRVIIQFTKTTVL